MKSAIIVTYRDEGLIEENVKDLLKLGYEVIVAADDPNEKVLRILRRYPVKATISKKRRGKWKALNDALKLASGEQILFLDSDTKIVNLCDLNGKDAIEIRKEVSASSVLEKLINIDYFVMFLTAKLAEKFNSCLSINGSAFMIKRSVLQSVGGFRRRINEDTDLGVRLGLRGFRVCVDGKAITKVPSNLKDWFVQRERWSLGGAEVIIENFWRIVKKPRLWIPYLFVFYPAIVGFLFSLLLPDSLILKLLYLLIPLMVFLSPKLLSLAMLMLFEIHTLKNLLVIMLSFVVWSATMMFLAKKFRYEIDCKLLPLYYFVYSPLWTMVCITSFFRVLILKLLKKEVKVKRWLI